MKYLSFEKIFAYRGEITMKKRNMAFISMAVGAVAGLAGGKCLFNKKDKSSDKVMKFKSQFYLVSRWLGLKQEKRNLSEYFEENGYKNIAIYGLGTLGEYLSNELEGTSIEVKFAIDENVDARDNRRYPIYHLDDNFKDEVDAIIVTAIFAFDDIKKKCEEKLNCPIISLEDVIYVI